MSDTSSRMISLEHRISPDEHKKTSDWNAPNTLEKKRERSRSCPSTTADICQASIKMLETSTTTVGTL